MFRAVIAFLVLILTPSAAFADKRVALVIGNAAYKHAGELANPRNDATDVAAELKALGFDVTEGRDLDKAGMERARREFADRLEGADVGLFFYAGHGLQVRGVNYLLGVDAKLEKERDLDFEAMKVEAVLTHMEREAKTNIVFLDACRNNPLARNLARTMGTRGVNENNGLAPVASALGTFIAFATQPGNIASDGVGRNSPFTTALKKHIPSPGVALGDMMIEVRKEVVGATKGAQVPWDHSALQGRFFFKAKAEEPTLSAGPSQPTVSTTPSQIRLSEAAEAWDRTKDATSTAVLEAFIARYTDTFYAELARARLGDLKKQQPVAASPSPAVQALPTGSTQVAVATPAAPMHSPPRLSEAAVSSITKGLLSVAEAIKEKRYRVEALASVAEAQAQAGFAKEAVATFQDAVRVARDMNEKDERVDALTKIAKGQAKAGLTKEAVAATQEALRIARSIKDEDERGGPFASVAEAQAKAGQITEALQLARSIKDKDYRNWALRDIAGAQAKAGQITEALQLARSIKDDEYASRADALMHIAEAQAKAGLGKEAVATTQEALRAARSKKDYDPWGLRWTARALAEARHFPEALQIGQLHEKSREETLNEVATAQAKAGQISEAVRLARSISDGNKRNWALSAVASAQAEAGQFPEALNVVRSIEPDSDRANALTNIAEAQVKAGQAAQAIGTLEEATQAARSIDAEAFRASTLARIATVQTKVGLAKEGAATSQEALRIARSIKGELHRGMALITVGEEQLKAGQLSEAAATLEEAIQVARSMNDERDRSFFLLIKPNSIYKAIAGK
jgi:tetratricopeptide (TPR) repeat protein